MKSKERTDEASSPLEYSSGSGANSKGPRTGEDLRGVLVKGTEEGGDLIAFLGEGAGLNWKDDVGEAARLVEKASTL